MRLSIGLLAATGALALTAVEAQAQVAQGWEVGVEGYGYRYEEAYEDIRVEDEGRFLSFNVEYGRPFAANWNFDARLWAGGGSVDYSANDGNRLEDVAQYMAQLELLVGRRFATSATSFVMPYAGIGGRSLSDRSGGLTTETGDQGYDREIGYSYVPLGVAAVTERPGGRRMAVYGQYNWVVGGTSRSEFGDIDPSAPTVEVDFESGHGWEIGAKLTTPVGRGTVSVQPFLRTWDIDQSTSAFFMEEDFTVELFEPANQTREVGVRFTYGF